MLPESQTPSELLVSPELQVFLVPLALPNKQMLPELPVPLPNTQVLAPHWAALVADFPPAFPVPLPSVHLVYFAQAGPAY